MFDFQQLVAQFAIDEDIELSDPMFYDILSSYLEQAVDDLDGVRPSTDDKEWSYYWTWDEADYLWRNIPAPD